MPAIDVCHFQGSRWLPKPTRGSVAVASPDTACCCLDAKAMHRTATVRMEDELSPFGPKRGLDYASDASNARRCRHSLRSRPQPRPCVTERIDDALWRSLGF